MNDKDQKYFVATFETEVIIRRYDVIPTCRFMYDDTFWKKKNREKDSRDKLLLVNSEHFVTKF